MMRRQVYEWRGLIPSTTYPTPYVLNQDPILTLSPAIPAWGTHANAQVDIFVGGLGNNLDIPGYVKATQFIVIEDIACSAYNGGAIQVRINTTDYFQNPDVTDRLGIPMWLIL